VPPLYASSLPRGHRTPRSPNGSTANPPRPRDSRPPALPRHSTLVAAETSSAPQKVAFGIFTLYLFLSFSKLHEFVLGDFRTMMLLLPLLVLTTILAGGLPGAILSRLGILFCALTVWLCFATPFGLWPGGSFETLRTYWLPSLTMFLLTASVVRTEGQIRTSMGLIATGGVILVILTFVYPGSMAGRLTFEFGSLSNPNDLANHLLFAFPFCLLAIRTDGISLKKAIAGLGIALIWITVFRTGSRGGLITLMLAGLVIFWHATVFQKFRILILSTAIAVIALASAPDRVLIRYRLMLGGAAEDERLRAERAMAEASADSRLDLLLQSLKITVQNPILGVGPGNFQLANNLDHQARGLRPPWQVSHNAFTQVSSEAGIPALLLYLAALIFTVRTSFRIYQRTRGRPELASIANMGYCLRLAAVTFTSAAFFTSIAYQYYFTTLAGLTYALDRAARHALENGKAGALPRTRPEPCVASQAT
jgi:O-antigen ligase